MNRGYTSEYEALPPAEVRLYDPLTNPDLPKFETPVDDRGLVVVPELIEVVKSTIDPSYKWPPGLKRHHFLWPEVLYPHEKDVYGNRGGFRNLPIHKGLLPRAFEQWLHIVTMPPEVPDPDVREYRIEAWRVAKDLFESASTTIHWQKMMRRRRQLIAENPNIVAEDFNGVDVIGEAIMAEEYERNKRGLELQLQRNAKIPEEHRLVELEQPTDKIARELGKLVASNSRYLVRSVRAA